MKKTFTSFLFSDTGFVTGIASAFNVPGNFYTFNSSDNPDTIALNNDVNMIGQDINGIINGK